MNIWDALNSCHFIESLNQCGTENHNITLETIVQERGINFSQGQRQLLCLSRAILKQSKVIILDEASASLDHTTDTKIQETIRTRFEKSTLLCIAHRLSTISDYDRILVLDKGKVTQYGPPHQLMRESGFYR